MHSKVHIKSSLLLGRAFPHEYIVLSSAKLQIWFFNEKENSVDEHIKQ